jgi:phospholipid/cholesterol/gamma-HCH transport system permease protein
MQSVHSLFWQRGMRPGEFARNVQSIGLSALPILGLVMFLIGFITALQSAAQLRLVGANIFVADLLAVGITAEMGPLMTAILVAGRSGSAIASEIATMKYTEELDALKTLGANPVRFVMVPKLWAMIFVMPILTLFADAMGIMGGTLIAMSYLDLSFDAFWLNLVKALQLEFLINGTVKSLVFGTLITGVACIQGIRFKGGADGVGRATTAAVVVSIFAIIMANSLLSLIFYM